jgi:NAD(P)H-dependent flavin oxidoreductase YrpB (nitropropane dioxygenase family)
MFVTRLTQMLGIKYPIVQGGLQWLATAQLASAVSEAGGLGIISSIYLTK